MTEQIKAERYAELVAAMRERDEALRKIAALDKRIGELVGLSNPAQTRKTPRQTISPKDFARGCGV